jgi:glucose 1-dehydrogenase
MRSVVLDFERRQVVEADLPEPRIDSPRQVLFRIHEVGVCGTDRELANFRMRHRPGDAPRIVIGHEALGQVVECGSEVQTLSRGDWVVPTIRRGCSPPCSSCASGRTDLCLTNGYSERGIHNLDGYFTEFAIDDASDLIRVPESMLGFAVLLEPLSVVEKAVERAIALRQSSGRSALVLGMGPVGMLAALILQLRGYGVTVLSLEAEDHPRAAILRSMEVSYTSTLAGFYDVIFEAAGSADLALAALKHLGPCGVFLVLGAKQVTGEFSFMNLILGNQTIAGTVNASRDAFELGARDLARIPERVLTSMFRRCAFADYPRTLFEPSAMEPKFVHEIANSLH